MILKRLYIGAVTTLFVLSAVLIAPISAIAAPSGGSGGQFLDSTNQVFSASNGLSSRYHIYANHINTSEEIGLLLYFHGDDAYEFNNPNSGYSLGGSLGVVARAQERNMIAVTMLAPDTTGSVTWWEQGSQNADYVKDFLDYLLSQYNIETGRVWLVGYSGGAQFITQFFVPKYSTVIDGGGAVIFGGGGAPYNVTPQPFAESFKANFPMHWYTGLLDDGSGGTYNALYHDPHGAIAGKAWYDQQGFTTSNEWPGGVAHDLGGVFGSIVGQQLALHDDGPYHPQDTEIVPAILNYTITPGEKSVTLDATTDDISRLTFRVSKNVFGTQTGYYSYDFPENTANTVQLSINNVLGLETQYYYQIEEGLQRNVIASGTFVTGVPTPPPAPDVLTHTVTPEETSVSLYAETKDIEQLTFRVSPNPFGTQDGYYVVANPQTTNNAVNVSINDVLSPDILYYYQIEEGSNRNVLESGTFRTKPVVVEPSVLSYTITPERNGARLVAYVSPSVNKVLFRVSKTPFGNQIGNYVYGYPDKNGYIYLRIRNELSRNTTYYYVIELNNQRVPTGSPNSGTFKTTR